MASLGHVALGLAAARLYSRVAPHPDAALARRALPWQPLPVAPIGIHFLSRAGLAVAKVEILAFAPLFLYGLWPRSWLPRQRR